MPRLVLLSGPSCVAKGPLIKSAQRFYPNIKFKEISVIKSLESRPGGLRSTDDPNDFRSAKEIMSLRGNPQYIVGDCRGKPQAIDLEKIGQELKNNELIYLEAYYTLGQQIRANIFRQAIPGSESTTIFVSPVSQQEIKGLKKTGVDIDNYLTCLMMNKQINRAMAMKAKINKADSKEFWLRAKDAYKEISAAHLFDGFLVNHDGEGSPNWHYNFEKNIFGRMPEGDAGRTLRSFAEILSGQGMQSLEKWALNLIP